jgi:hypothetical protein
MKNDIGLLIERNKNDVAGAKNGRLNVSFTKINCVKTA